MQLDFGGLPYAIYLQKGATLAFKSVSVTGAPNPNLHLNKTDAIPYGKYAVKELGPWPSITAEPGAQVGLNTAALPFLSMPLGTKPWHGACLYPRSWHEA